MGAAWMLRFAAQPTNICSLQIWLHLGENKQAFQLYKIYCQ